MSEISHDDSALWPIPFSPAQLSRIVVNTFRLSRGSESAQDPILAYQAEEYREQIRGADREQAEDLTVKAAEGMISSPFHPTSSGGEPLDAYIGVHFIYEALFDLANRNTLPVTTTSGTILTELIRADARWLPSTVPPRERDQSYEPPTYVSNIVRHVIVGEATGVSEIDNMLEFAALSLKEQQAEDTGMLDRALRLILPKVIRTHLETNTDDKNKVEEALKDKSYFRQLVAHVVV